MIRRGLIVGSYDTAANLWLLTGLDLAEPETVTNYVNVPGRRKGPLDLSTALTDGDPVYSSRTLTATFESSEGDRTEREDRISYMVNQLHGQQLNITLPDDPQCFLVGRVQVERVYNDPAHASVRLTATCEPWRYNNTETVATFQATETQQTGKLYNHGRLAMVPLLKVTGGDVQLVSGASSWDLSAGSYSLPDLFLPRRGLDIKYRGSGTLIFIYREAVL